LKTENLNQMNKFDAKKYYEILDADIDTDDQTLKIKYREKAKFWHPDHNPDENAMENFQKISVAYDVLHDHKKRLYYNMLSMVYDEKNFPDMATITPFFNEQKQVDLNIRSIGETLAVGKIFKTSQKHENHICSYQKAKKIMFWAGVKNWLLGWWAWNGFYKNWKAISDNLMVFESNKRENLKLFVHNMVAMQIEGKTKYAYFLAKLAKNYTSDAQEQNLLDRFIALTGENDARHIPEWDYKKLSLVQLFIPAIIGLVAAAVFLHMTFSVSFFEPAKDEINYNRKVRVMGGAMTFDDVVVGKILNVPSSISDESMLFHTKSEAKVMYGPNDDFDVLTTLEEGHTVRITGYTPDEAWYRVMIDNGDSGFLRRRYLAKGIKNPIPKNSKIYR